MTCCRARAIGWLAGCVGEPGLAAPAPSGCGSTGPTTVCISRGSDPGSRQSASATTACAHTTRRRMQDITNQGTWGSSLPVPREPGGPWGCKLHDLLHEASSTCCRFWRATRPPTPLQHGKPSQPRAFSSASTAAAAAGATRPNSSRYHSASLANNLFARYAAAGPQSRHAVAVLG